MQYLFKQSRYLLLILIFTHIVVQPGQCQKLKIHWKTSTKPNRIIPLLVSQNIIICQNSPQLIAYDATTGKKLWHFLEEEQVRPLPVYREFINKVSLHQGFVYLNHGYSIRRKFGSITYNTLVKLEAQTGKIMWKKKLKPKEVFVKSKQGLLLVDKGNELVCLNPLNGKKKWEITISQRGEAFLYQNMIYTMHYASGQPYVVAIHYQDGNIQWQKAFSDGKKIDATLFSLHQDKLYVYDAKNIYALYLNGKKYWQTKIDPEFTHWNKQIWGYQFFGERLYFTTRYDELRAISLQDGQTVWTSSLRRNEILVFHSSMILAHQDYLIFQIINNEKKIALFNQKNGKFFKEISIPQEQVALTIDMISNISSQIISYQGKLFYASKEHLYCTSFK